MVQKIYGNIKVKYSNYGWSTILDENDNILLKNVFINGGEPIHGLILVYKNDGYNFFDIEAKKLLLEKWFTYIKIVNNGEHFIVQNGKYNYNVLKRNGEWLFADWYNMISFVDLYQMFRLENNHNKKNLAYTNGILVLEKWVDDIWSFKHDTLLSICDKGVFNILLKNGQLFFKENTPIITSVIACSPTIYGVRIINKGWNFVDVAKGENFIFEECFKKLGNVHENLVKVYRQPNECNVLDITTWQYKFTEWYYNIDFQTKKIAVSKIITV